MRYCLGILLSLIPLSAVLAQEKAPCIFCAIASGQSPASVVYRDDRLIAFMDHAPVNPGHTLIVPVEHAETLLDLPPATATEMMILARKIGGALRRSGLKAEAFQLKMNNGKPVQGLMHAHLHVYPRFEGDEGDYFPYGAERARREEIDEAARKLKLALDLGELYAEYYEESLQLFPWKATLAGDHRYNDRFPNILSDAHRTAVRQFYDKYLAQLRQFDRTLLPPSEQITYDSLQWECEINLAQFEFPTHLLPISQFQSWHLFVAIWAGGTSAQPFKTVGDYENWLKRLDSFLEWSGSAIENMREGMASGYVLPKALTEKVIPQLAKMTKGPEEEHGFYAPIQNFPADFSEADRERLARAYAAKIRGSIIPAFATLHAFMLNEYLPASRETSGISAIPNGRDFYDLQIKTYTTTELTAEEVFDLGEKEVERIRGEMEKVKQQAGFQGTLREFFDHVRENKKLMPFTDPQQVLDNFEAIHRKMQPSLARLFNRVPKTAFEVRRTEAFREKSAAAQYMAGSVDGSRPGIFYVPIPEVAEYNVFSDESLYLHEAIPGHHYQISLQRENRDLPSFRRTAIISAFAEGWALYCETLGKELGLYEDPYQYFGMLSAEMHRAIRLVVDTGLHAKGWTREQAIAYSLENEAEAESSVISEIERYMAWPGQALSYKIGQLKIQQLRSRAEKELGEKFDLREFHDEILETGCVPLQVLENKIIRWIEEKGNGQR